MMYKLKSCPFCGGPAMGPDLLTDEHGTKTVAITCKRKGCVTVKREPDRVDSAVTYWNTRAGVKQ